MENFTSLALSAPLARAIGDLGYEKPSPIQAQALPILLGKPTDFIGLAATGTGKTAAFGIPMLEKLDPARKGVQALIMCPTRELVLQVAGQINLLGKHMGIQALPIYGGAGYDEQLRGLKRGAQVVVGTPGRMIDHINRKTLKLENIHIAILDEADEMISMGFREDMETILPATPRDQNNIWLFSATMSASVRKVADEFLRNPQSVQVNRSEMLSSTIEQQYVLTQEKNKPEVLCKLIDAADEFYGLVFCQTKALVVELTRYLTERGYKADNLHGDKTQGAREITLKDFRARRVQILVCTDVAARGLDVKDVTHVMNFSIPRELDNYVHRIGRTARSGKAGVAISLVTPSHRYLLTRIEKMTKSQIVEIQVPTRKSLGLKKVTQTLAKVAEQNNFIRAVDLMDEATKTALAAMTPEEVAGRFLVMMHPEIFSEQMPQMNRPQYDRPLDGPRDDRRPARAAYRGGGDRPERSGSRYDRPAPRNFDRPAWTPANRTVKPISSVKPESSVKPIEAVAPVTAAPPVKSQPVEKPAPVAAVAVKAERAEKPAASAPVVRAPKFERAAAAPSRAERPPVRAADRSERPERSDRTIRREPYRPARVERADAFDRPPQAERKPFKPAFKKPYVAKSDEAGKTYKPYRAPRSEKADQEKSARPERPFKKRAGSLMRAPGSKWQAENKNKNNKKKGGNYPPRRKVLGYSKESSKEDNEK